MVLLHELAHAICPPSEHHGELFWTTAWKLYRRFNLPIRKVKVHEEAYRKTAHFGYLCAEDQGAGVMPRADGSYFQLLGDSAGPWSALALDQRHTLEAPRSEGPTVEGPRG